MAAPTFPGRERVAPGALGRLSRNPAAPWRHIDLALVASVICISVLGCLMIFSATRGRDPSSYDTGFLSKQVLFMSPCGTQPWPSCQRTTDRQVLRFLGGSASRSNVTGSRSPSAV